MENGQKKLKELFDGRKIFKIPDYQRAYAWDESRQLPILLRTSKTNPLIVITSSGPSFSKRKMTSIKVTM